MWFEQTEGTQDLDNFLPYERIRFIKEQLFRVNSADGTVVKADDLVMRLRRPCMEKPTCKTFNDFIFAPVKSAQ